MITLKAEMVAFCSMKNCFWMRVLLLGVVQQEQEGWEVGLRQQLMEAEEQQSPEELACMLKERLVVVLLLLVAAAVAVVKMTELLWHQSKEEQAVVVHPGVQVQGNVEVVEIQEFQKQENVMQGLMMLEQLM